jgi:hypothetical protein
MILLAAQFTLQHATKTYRGRKRYSPTLSLTSALGESGCSTLRPSCFTTWKAIWCSLYRLLGEPQGRYGRLRKISQPPPPTGIGYPALSARDESLYQLSYPGPLMPRSEKKKELSNRRIVISIYVKPLAWGFAAADCCCYLGWTWL